MGRRDLLILMFPISISDTDTYCRIVRLTSIMLQSTTIFFIKQSVIKLVLICCYLNRDYYLCYYKTRFLIISYFISHKLKWTKNVVALNLGVIVTRLCYHVVLIAERTISNTSFNTKWRCLVLIKQNFTLHTNTKLI